MSRNKPSDNEVPIRRPEHYSDEQWEAYKQGAADYAELMAVTTNEMASRMAAQTDDGGDGGSDGDADDGQCPECGGDLRFEIGSPEGVCEDCGEAVETDS
jgi:hypothetical protein